MEKQNENMEQVVSEVEESSVETQNENSVNETSSDYEEKMLDAFVQKPDKLYWYKRAFAKYNFNGMDKIAWNWSWWAFFGGFWFLLYRKAYLPALALFGLSIIAGFIPIVGPLILAVLTGGYGTYFIYKKYKDLKTQIEATEKDEKRRIEAMLHLGGYNSWVVWLAIGITVLFVVLFLFAGIFAAAAAGSAGQGGF